MRRKERDAPQVKRCTARKEMRLNERGKVGHNRRCIVRIRGVNRDSEGSADRAVGKVFSFSACFFFNR